MFAGLTILTTQVMCREFSDCYDDVNICLWTDGSVLTQSAAQTACRERDSSFLPRVTNSNIQDKLTEFRSAAYKVLGDNGFSIDVSAVVANNFHWIDGSPLAGWCVCVSDVRVLGPDFQKILGKILSLA